jgi:hypothetical protein
MTKTNKTLKNEFYADSKCSKLIYLNGPSHILDIPGDIWNSLPDQYFGSPDRQDYIRLVIYL